MNEFEAYLLGALRDATIDIRKGKNYEIKIAQKSKEWLEYLQQIFEQLFGKRGRITKHRRNYWILRINDKSIVEKILELSEIKIPQEEWNTPTKLKETKDERILISYIRGFFDAEGGLPKNIDKDSQKYIIFSQKNKESLEFLQKMLNKMGIKTTKITFCGGVWEFRITRKESIIKFIEKIGSLHPDKKSRLENLKRVLLP